MLREAKLESATTVFRLISELVGSFAPQEGDVGFVVISKTS